MPLYCIDGMPVVVGLILTLTRSLLTPVSTVAVLTNCIQEAHARSARSHLTLTRSLLTLTSTLTGSLLALTIVLTNYIQEAYAAGKISDHVLALLDANLVQVFYFQKQAKVFHKG